MQPKSNPHFRRPMSDCERNVLDCDLCNFVSNAFISGASIVNVFRSDAEFVTNRPSILRKETTSRLHGSNIPRFHLYGISGEAEKLRGIDPG